MESKGHQSLACRQRLAVGFLLLAFHTAFSQGFSHSNPNLMVLWTRPNLCNDYTNFYVTNIPALFAYYTGDGAVTNSSGKVTNLVDQWTNHWDLTNRYSDWCPTIGGQLNGHKYLSFSNWVDTNSGCTVGCMGTPGCFYGQFLIHSNAVVQITNVEVAWVGKIDCPKSTYSIPYNLSAEPYMHVEIGRDNPNGPAVYSTRWSASTLVSHIIDTNNWNIFNDLYATNYRAVYYNGNLANWDNTVPPIMWGGGWVINKVALGCGTEAGNTPCCGYVPTGPQGMTFCEMAIFTNTLSSSNRDALTAYWTCKYGLPGGAANTNWTGSNIVQNTILWFKSDTNRMFSGSLPATNGQPVTMWLDDSPTKSHAYSPCGLTDWNFPPGFTNVNINGLMMPALNYWDGWQAMKSAGPKPSTNHFTVFAVADFALAGLPGAPFNWGLWSSDTLFEQMWAGTWYYEYAGNMNCAAGSHYCFYSPAVSSHEINTNWQVIRTTCSNNFITIYTNTVPAILTPCSAGVGTWLSGFLIGNFNAANATNGGNYEPFVGWRGRIAEIIAVAGDVLSNDCWTVENYLTNKFGIYP